MKKLLENGNLILSDGDLRHIRLTDGKQAIAAMTKVGLKQLTEMEIDGKLDVYKIHRIHNMPRKEDCTPFMAIEL